MAFLLYYKAIFKALELINEILIPKASGPFVNLFIRKGKINSGREKWADYSHLIPSRVSHAEFLGFRGVSLCCLV